MIVVSVDVRRARSADFDTSGNFFSLSWVHDEAKNEGAVRSSRIIICVSEDELIEYYSQIITYIKT